MTQTRIERFQRGDKVRINGTGPVCVIAQIDQGFAIVLEKLTGFPHRVSLEELRTVTA